MAHVEVVEFSSKVLSFLTHLSVITAPLPQSPTCCHSEPYVNNKNKNPKKSKQSSSYTSISIPAVKTDVTQINCSDSRTVFLDLKPFYQCWRLLPSKTLFDAILILPNIYIEWILNPSQITNSEIPKRYFQILTDSVFINLLQWKYQQSLLFCMSKTLSNTKGSNIAPFWKHLSRSLCELSDPLTYKTSNYKPLIFDISYYTNPYLFRSKFGVTANHIFSELKCTQKMSNKVMKEILFQSNPSLNVVVSYSDIVLNVLSVTNNKKPKSKSQKLIFSPKIKRKNVQTVLSPGLEHLCNGIIQDLDKHQNSYVLAAERKNVTPIFSDDGEWWIDEEYDDYGGKQQQ